MWSGDRFNRRRARADKVRIPIDHDVLKDGALGADGIWRQIVTVFDAIAKGFDLVDLAELQRENSVDEFDNLFRCLFLDDSQSMFPFEIMRRCMVDSWDVWRDVQPYAAQPYAGEVWLGYDPNASEAGTGDDAALVAIAAPLAPGARFRVLEKKRLKGLQFDQQAAAIREMAGRYRVTRIAIDVTGAGRAVEQLVRKWFPLVTAITYSPLSKSQMVLKAKNVISAGRLEFDAGWMDMMSAFMAIRPEITKHGITYVAGRAGGVGHADWPGGDARPVLRTARRQRGHRRHVHHGDFRCLIPRPFRWRSCLFCPKTSPHPRPPPRLPLPSATRKACSTGASCSTCSRSPTMAAGTSRRSPTPGWAAAIAWPPITRAPSCSSATCWSPASCPAAGCRRPTSRAGRSTG
jgi:hypothetical protein